MTIHNEAESSDIKFEQLSLDFDIMTEKKYTEETGLELPKVLDTEKVKKAFKRKTKVKSEDVKSSDSSDESLEIIHDIHKKAVDNIENEVRELKAKTDGSVEKSGRRGLNIASTTTNKSDFINAVEESNKIKEERVKKELSNIDAGYPYKGTHLMTNAEKQLFLFMENNLILTERVRIIPKVRLADIIQVEERLCKNKDALWKITSKHVDFIIVDKYTFDLICVVELDDYTHETPAAKMRDEFVFYSLLSAGIHLHRVKCRISDVSKKDLRGIEEDVLMYYRKPCAMCGADTRVKSKTSGNKIGHRFYSCTNFPNCRHTLDID